MRYAVLPINQPKFDACAALLIARRTPYVFGGKVRDLSANPPTFAKDGSATGGIDCSGFMRWLLFHATIETDRVPPDGIDIGDGSFTQGGFLRSYGLKPTDPANCGLEDGHLRLCVHHPDELDYTGHIWAVRNRVTTESYGGHGPGHRVWDAALGSGHRLNALATLCFVAT